jgi:two-component system chemotaxis response regulator CheY
VGIHLPQLKIEKGGTMTLKMLTVDDSPSVRKMVEFTLKAKGFEVGSAGDGHEALELMAKENFDAIILDINMPRMNGLEFLKKIRGEEAYTSIPVVMLTTEGQEEDKDKAISLGATAYIVKPFKPTQLLGLIEQILPSS